MKYSRRDLGLLLPALAAASASAQTAESTGAPAPAAAAENLIEKLPVMKTKAFLYNEIPVTVNGKNKSRRMFTAKTHTGFKMESHQSDIAPGEVNHPPHQHLREEMMLVRLGTEDRRRGPFPFLLRGPGGRMTARRCIHRSPDPGVLPWPYRPNPGASASSDNGSSRPRPPSS